MDLQKEPAIGTDINRSGYQDSLDCQRVDPKTGGH